MQGDVGGGVAFASRIGVEAIGGCGSGGARGRCNVFSMWSSSPVSLQWLWLIIFLLLFFVVSLETQFRCGGFDWLPRKGRVPLDGSTIAVAAVVVVIFRPFPCNAWWF